MFGSLIGLSEFWCGGFGCEDLILIHFCLQMLNDNKLKPNNEMFKMQISTQTENYN